MIRDARRLDSRIRLARSVRAAQALYRSLGFRDIPPYRHTAIPGTSYLELRLGGAAPR